MCDDPLAYFITWTCYGTWLPGDERGWTKWHKGVQRPIPKLVDWVRHRLTEAPVTLDTRQRRAVHEAIAECCQRRSWTLHAANCRSNHCHVVVTAREHDGEQVRDQLKAWSTRRLRDMERDSGVPEGRLRRHWWTRKGSVRRIDNSEALEAAIAYTIEAQDTGGSKRNM